MRKRNPTILACGTALAVLPFSASGAVPTPLGPGFDSSAYTSSLKVTAFATGLNYPASMQQYNGGILVGTTTGASLFSASAAGHLLLLTDTNKDGVADQTVDLTPTTGLAGCITAVRQAGNLLLVTNNVGVSTPIISILKPGATPTSPMINVGSINLAFSAATWSHHTSTLETRPTPNQPGSYDVFFNIGSRVNDVSDAGNFGTYYATATTAGNATGLSGAHLDSESIYKSTFSYNGTTAAFSAPVKVAGGLRNAAGIAVQPGTGNLFYDDNGMDGTSANGHPADKYGNAPYSLDTLHKINQPNIGVSSPNTNFTTDFYEDSPPNAIVHGSPDAIAKFGPFGPYNPADQNSSPNESEGANEMAFAPASFPAGLNNGVFIGFHGEFDHVGAPNTTTGAGNEENPVVYYDFTTGTYWHFIGTNEPSIGHLDSMLSTGDALFMADIADGSINNAPFNTGAIYEVKAVAASTWIASGAGTWATSSNWDTPAAPNAQAAVAVFANSIGSSAATITLASPVTVGSIVFTNNLGGSYTLAGSFTLNIDDTGEAIVNPRINIVTGSHAINAPINLTSGVSINFQNNSSLAIGNSITGTGPISVNGAGTLIIHSAGKLNPASALSITTGATVAIDPVASPSTPNIQTIATLSIDNTGHLDIGNNELIITTATLASAKSSLTGGEIITTLADAHHGIGYVSSGSGVELRFTFIGDTNLDGSINFADLVKLAQNYNSTNATWSTGDFNYDSTTNFADLVSLAQNYNAVLSPNEAGFSPLFMSDWNLAQSEITAVPEPASISLLVLGGTTLLARRRARSSV